MLIISTIIISIYLILLVWFSNNLFYRKNSNVIQSNHNLPQVSIIVAARNEEKHIEKLIKCLVNQDYLNDKYEIIIADDRSSDKTNQIIKKYENKFSNVKSIFIDKTPLGWSGKKWALTKAISISSGGIVTTSARPEFYTYGTGNSVEVTNDAKIPFSLAVRNVGSHFDLSNYWFLTPVAGLYLFKAQIYNYSGTVTINFRIRHENTSNADSTDIGRMNINAPTNDQMYHITALAHVPANRRVFVVNTVGASRYVYLNDAGAHTHFQGCLIG